MSQGLGSQRALHNHLPRITTTAHPQLDIQQSIITSWGLQLSIRSRRGKGFMCTNQKQLKWNAEYGYHCSLCLLLPFYERSFHPYDEKNNTKLQKFVEQNKLNSKNPLIFSRWRASGFFRSKINLNKHLIALLTNHGTCALNCLLY